MRGQPSEEERLSVYLAARARDPDAALPDGLDPLYVALLDGLGELLPPEPEPRFAAGLHRRLAAEAAALTGDRPRALAPPRHASRWWPVLAGVATAAVLVVALIGARVWLGGEGSVSAAEIIERAGTATTNPSGYRNFVVTETAEVQTAPLGGSGEQVRSEVTRWYAAPGSWRREVTLTVVGADGRALSNSGLTSVSDGATVWLYRLRDNTVVLRPLSQAPGDDELGPFPEVTGGLSSLLEQTPTCYAPRLRGAETVAGRATWVVNLGASRCPGLDGGASDRPVAWTLWVDKDTYLILKAVQDIDGQVFATTTVTSVRYDVPIEAQRFTFNPPPGARVRDFRGRAP